MLHQFFWLKLGLETLAVVEGYRNQDKHMTNAARLVSYVRWSMSALYDVFSAKLFVIIYSV